MTVTQSVGFLENRDTSTISHNHFNQEPSDRYPTFSICLKGKEIYWTTEESLFSTSQVTSSQYAHILNGNGFRIELNETLQAYQKNIVDINDISAIDFEDHALNPSDVLVDAE